MRAVNHGLTGAAIAVTIRQPLLALPLAFVSHFVCDLIPHSGDPNEKVGDRKFKITLAADILSAALITLLVAWIWRETWWQVTACAFVAASPDLAWLHYQILNPTKKLDPLSKFHHDIQWYQKPPGFFLEAAWFVSFFGSLIYLGVK